MQSFHIFSMFYGQHHVDLFRRACFRSLNWPKNRASLDGKDWWVFTKREHFEEVTQIFKDAPFNLYLCEIDASMRVAGCGFVKTSQCDGGVILLNGLRDEILRCLQSGQKMLFAPPDTIFGDGTVQNLIDLSVHKNTCVAVAHPRVLPKILEDLEYGIATEGAFKNSKLVSLALKHAHDSWKFAEMGHENNNSFVGGIAWKKLGDTLISVTHRLPTPYFMGFEERDFDYWWGTVSFGALDHSWPGERLIKQERLRVVGSSDAAFIVEVTDHDKNVPPIVKAQQQQQVDEYWGDKTHHSVNRLFNVIWRGY